MTGEYDYLGYGWYVVSGIVILVWLRRTDGGRTALAGAPVRHHQLTIREVMIPGAVFLLSLGAGSIFFQDGSGPDWIRQDMANVVLGVGQMVCSVLVLIIAARYFVNALRGFGLHGGRWRFTLSRALLYYVAATGTTMLVLAVSTALLSRWDYETPKHTFLELLEQKPPWRSVVLLFVLPAVVAPVAEELFFRGLLQSYFVKILAPDEQGWDDNQVEGSDVVRGAKVPGGARWKAIFLSGLIFACLHQWQHWPALIVLSFFLGYSYERHGNLWIPIIVHSMFNILPLVVTVTGGAA